MSEVPVALDVADSYAFSAGLEFGPGLHSGDTIRCAIQVALAGLKVAAYHAAAGWSRCWDRLGGQNGLPDGFGLVEALN
jgi:hypothetical protein